MRVDRKPVTPRFHSSVPPVLDIDRMQTPVAFDDQRRASGMRAETGAMRPGGVTSGEATDHARSK